MQHHCLTVRNRRLTVAFEDTTAISAAAATDSSSARRGRSVAATAGTSAAAATGISAATAADRGNPRCLLLPRSVNRRRLWLPLSHPLSTEECIIWGTSPGYYDFISL